MKAAYETSAYNVNQAESQKKEKNWYKATIALSNEKERQKHRIWNLKKQLQALKTENNNLRKQNQEFYQIIKNYQNYGLKKRHQGYMQVGGMMSRSGGK